MEVNATSKIRLLQASLLPYKTKETHRVGIYLDHVCITTTHHYHDANYINAYLQCILTQNDDPTQNQRLRIMVEYHTADIYNIMQSAGFLYNNPTWMSSTTTVLQHVAKSKCAH
eukprot:3488228-Amphidinium_carterae.1